MQIRQSLDDYDGLQMEFVAAMIDKIRDHLAASGIPAESAYDLAGNIAFSVGVLIDQGKDEDANGPRIRPALCFFDNNDTNTLVMPPEGASWMHEYVFGCLDEAFGKS
jgi:hypothetical protein